MSAIRSPLPVLAALAIVVMPGCGSSGAGASEKGASGVGAEDGLIAADIKQADSLAAVELEQQRALRRLDSLMPDTPVFPPMTYRSVKVLMLDRKWERKGGVRSMSYFDQDATGFVDSTGKPLHGHLRSIGLNGSQTDELMHLFRGVPQDTSSVRYATDCIPVYRDAIVFYDEGGDPIAWVNICFMCQEVMFIPRSPALYDFERWRFDELRAFFERIGVPRPPGEP